jgi:hypothetical protein
MLRQTWVCKHFFEAVISVILDICLEVEFLDHLVTLFLTFWGTARWFSIDWTILHSQQQFTKIPISHILYNTCYFLSFLSFLIVVTLTDVIKPLFFCKSIFWKGWNKKKITSRSGWGRASDRSVCSWVESFLKIGIGRLQYTAVCFVIKFYGTYLYSFIYCQWLYSYYQDMRNCKWDYLWPSKPKIFDIW